MSGTTRAAAWTAAVAILLTAAPASAAKPHYYSFTATGRLTFIWRGDPARGCAAAGVCGVTGSLQVYPSGGSSGGDAPPFVEIGGGSAVARVDSTASNGSVLACADLVPVDISFDLGTGPFAPLDVGDSESFPSSGRCAGPTARDLVSLKLPQRRLGNRSYDLHGAVTLGAGPFTVKVVSTIEAIYAPQNYVGPGGVPPFPRGPAPPKPKNVLVEQATYDYTLVPATGAVMVTFAGLPEPACDPLAACGAAGTLDDTLNLRRQSVSIEGERFVERPVGRSRALADLRAGRLAVSLNVFVLTLGGSLNARIEQEGSLPCEDRAAQPGIPVLVDPGRSAFGIAVTGGYYDEGTPEDLLRTRCPGPDTADILGLRSLGSGSIPYAALGSRNLMVQLIKPHSFVSDDYSGGWDGSLLLRLKLKRETGGTSEKRHVYVCGDAPC